MQFEWQTAWKWRGEKRGLICSNQMERQQNRRPEDPNGLSLTGFLGRRSQVLWWEMRRPQTLMFFTMSLCYTANSAEWKVKSHVQLDGFWTARSWCSASSLLQTDSRCWATAATRRFWTTWNWPETMRSTPWPDPSRTTPGPPGSVWRWCCTPSWMWWVAIVSLLLLFFSIDDVCNLRTLFQTSTSIYFIY